MTTMPPPTPSTEHDPPGQLQASTRAAQRERNHRSHSDNTHGWQTSTSFCWSSGINFRQASHSGSSRRQPESSGQSPSPYRSTAPSPHDIASAHQRYQPPRRTNRGSPPGNARGSSLRGGCVLSPVSANGFKHLLAHRGSAADPLRTLLPHRSHCRSTSPKSLARATAVERVEGSHQERIEQPTRRE
jgi:hypothetical protein